MAKRGRKPVYATDEERKATLLANKQKFKNITLDADLVEALNATADKMEAEFGFRPTLSQTVRYLIKKHLSRGQPIMITSKVGAAKMKYPTA